MKYRWWYDFKCWLSWKTCYRIVRCKNSGNKCGKLNIKTPNNLLGLCKKHREEFHEKLDFLCKENAERPLIAQTLNFRELVANIKCMISGKKIEPEYLSKENDQDPVLDYKIRESLSSGAYLDGICDVINAGFGSKHDGDCFLIAISDEEIDKLLAEGKIQRVGSYM